MNTFNITTFTGSLQNKSIQLVNARDLHKVLQVKDLQELAYISNDAVPVEGLPLQQRMMVAGFAKSAMTAEQLKKFAELLKEIHTEKENNG